MQRYPNFICNRVHFYTRLTSQRHYTSANYTHAARDMADRGVNVIVQLVGIEERDGEICYSFGSNPDTTQDLLDIFGPGGVRATSHGGGGQSKFAFYDRQCGT